MLSPGADNSHLVFPVTLDFIIVFLNIDSDVL